MPRRRPSTDPLSDADRRFVDAYLVNPNATRAYLAVHPTVTYSTARTQGNRLLTRPDIGDEIRAGRRAQQHHTGVTARRVIRELAAVAFADALDLLDAGGSLRPMNKVPPGCRAAVRSVTFRQVSSRTVGSGKAKRTVTTDLITVRFHDKLKALVKLGKYVGLDLDPHPLDALLNALPAAQADELRQHLRVPAPSAN